MSMKRLGVWLGMFFVLACAHKKAPPLSGAMPEVGDSPLELASDVDLSERRDQFDALATAEERTTHRAELAKEYERRIREGLATEERSLVSQNFGDYLALWNVSDLTPPLAKDLGRIQGSASAVYDYFARTGGETESVMALAALSIVEPKRAKAHVQEIETIIQYVDGLALAKHGPGAQGARPVMILETTYDALPSPWVAKRLIRLYKARQSTIHKRFVREGADVRLLQVHGDSLLHTVKFIVAKYARSGQLSLAPAEIRKVRGVGDDRVIRGLVEAALKSTNPGPWLELATFYLTDPADAKAALAICLAGSKRFPNDSTLRLAAAESAWALEKVLLAIRLYEEGLTLAPNNVDASERLSELYTMRVGTLASRERPYAAEALLARYENFYKKASEATQTPINPDPASAYATMGHGLASLGELPKADRYFDRSLKLRVNRDALHYKASVALRKGNFLLAATLLKQADMLPAESIQKRFDRMKSLRLLAEAQADLGEDEQSSATLTRAARGWIELFRTTNLPAPFLADALAEHAKIMWDLDKKDEALVSFDRAVRADPSGSAVHADVVAFLIMRDQPQQALDTYYRALASSTIDSYFKVYMSLWVIADAHRQDHEPDPHAMDYLRSREGPLWYDALAQYAVGKRDLQSLEAMAETRGRRAELFYYTAVLGRDADEDQAEALLNQVLDTDMVLYFEYEMAQYWLKRS